MNKQSEAIRGMMLDAARLPESPSYYRRFFDFCERWQINTVLFRLADDVGSALKFTSHPDLITHTHAFTATQMRELVQYAQQRDITLIPEIESFGHSRYITDAPAYAHLSDCGEADGNFNGLCPVHPDTHALLTDLFREVAEIFPSPYVHAGCDEVNWGGSELSKQAIAKRGRAQVNAHHLNKLQEIAASMGKDLVVWADHILGNDGSVLNRLDRRIILHDWSYANCDPLSIRRRAEESLDAGCRVLGGPALHWCRWGVRIGREQLDNIDAYIQAYEAIDDPRSLGVLVTNWVPSRYLQNGIWDSLTYAAMALREGPDRAVDKAWSTFVTEHLGATWNAAWQEIFTDLYREVPQNRKCASPNYTFIDYPMNAHDPATLNQSLAGEINDGNYQQKIDELNSLAQRLESQRSDVTANVADLDAMILAVSYLAYLFDRVLRWRRAAQQTNDPATLPLTLQDIAHRDQAMLDAVLADHTQGRFPDTILSRATRPNDTSINHLLHYLSLACKFSARLAKNPSMFNDIVVTPCENVQQ